MKVYLYEQVKMNENEGIIINIVEEECEMPGM